MSQSVEIPRCQHIEVNGLQCGSPALRTKKSCYFHNEWRQSHRLRYPRKGTPVTLFDLPPLEEAKSDFTAHMMSTGSFMLPPEAFEETEQQRAEDQRLRNLEKTS
ncbi:MAG TPA: hypothetical protein VEV41_07065 [Terriglobales bacterium]|nr:hypothetical protein [Terriglobales bacterium]